MDRKVITIGRQRWSGGHTIGKIVAERLKIPFYDKKWITWTRIIGSGYL